MDEVGAAEVDLCLSEAARPATVNFDNNGASKTTGRSRVKLFTKLSNKNPHVFLDSISAKVQSVLETFFYR
jgi:hypothetical protein